MYPNVLAENYSYLDYPRVNFSRSVYILHVARNLYSNTITSFIASMVYFVAFDVNLAHSFNLVLVNLGFLFLL